MRAKEIMTKQVISINPEDNARNALDTLFKMRISGLPVIDNAGKLVGMFTEKETITKILPSYVENVGRFAYEENPKQVKQKILSFIDMKVKDVMRKDIITLDEDTTLCEVARLMLTQKARRIIVLNKSKDVVGIISRGDVVKSLFEEYK
ncbi:MAG: CBS domain-containing protein [Candidatus Omnitrophota bacterium]